MQKWGISRSGVWGKWKDTWNVNKSMNKNFKSQSRALMSNSLRSLTYIIINGNTGIMKIAFICEDNCHKFSGNFWKYSCVKFPMSDILVFGLRIILKEHRTIQLLDWYLDYWTHSIFLMQNLNPEEEIHLISNRSLY